MDSTVKRFELNNVDHSKQNPQPVSTLDSLKNWVESFAKTDMFSFAKVDYNTQFKELNRNFTSEITHGGFIHYLHLCWAREMGCEIRPDMVYYTIISELASNILSKPESYKYLFTNAQEKETIISVVEDGLVRADRLVEEMRKTVNSPEFLAAVCDVDFASDAPNASYARKMTFACMGTPFYNYMGTMCGIPHLDLVGSEDDWTKLHAAVINLSQFKPSGGDGYSAKHRLEWHEKHFKAAVNTIANIIFHRFNKTLTSEEFPFVQTHASAQEFFNDIFNYGENTKCGSGHTENLVHGWAKLFYQSGCQKESDLEHFPSHVNYVPFTLDFSDKCFCQVTTLAFSELDGQTLRPGYGIVTYEVTDENAYNKIANPERTDENGRKYQPLSLKQMKRIVDEGKEYSPACEHYGRETTVICDRCRKYISVCIGHGKNHDLCLPCVEWVKSEWSRIYHK